VLPLMPTVAQQERARVQLFALALPVTVMDDLFLSSSPLACLTSRAGNFAAVLMYVQDQVGRRGTSTRKGY
jgi:hypothetical protein